MIDPGWLSGVLSTASVGVLAGALINWLRHRKRDNAIAMKGIAEAKAIEEGSRDQSWQRLYDAAQSYFINERKFLQVTMEDQKLRFEQLVAQERIDCDMKMEVQRNHYDSKIEELYMQLTEVKILLNKKP